MKTILITGGSGYIGSHLSLFLQEMGYSVVIFDRKKPQETFLKFFSGFFYQGDLLDKFSLSVVFQNHQIDSIFHLAGETVVSESVLSPFKFYQSNVSGLLTLLEVCSSFGKSVRSFVFASTASVYDGQTQGLLSETTGLGPLNPYGHSKLMCEQILKDVSKQLSFNYGILRFFNVAGADSLGRTGQQGEVSTHLIKILSEYVLGKRSCFSVYGNDYNTPDGTCLRDYIHVMDLVKILARTDYILETQGSGSSFVANCGYGKGYSVLDVIKAFETVLGNKLSYSIESRRPGDPASLIADVSFLKSLMPESFHETSLESIVLDAFLWESGLSKKNI